MKVINTLSTDVEMTWCQGMEVWYAGRFRRYKCNATSFPTAGEIRKHIKDPQHQKLQIHFSEQVTRLFIISIALYRLILVVGSLIVMFIFQRSWVLLY